MKLSQLQQFFALTGESIPIRLFLSPYELTPTYRNINNKFSVKYFLNLVLVDDEDRRYFKQQEITVYRLLETSWFCIQFRGAQTYSHEKKGSVCTLTDNCSGILCWILSCIHMIYKGFSSVVQTNSAYIGQPPFIKRACYVAVLVGLSVSSFT